MYKIKDRLRAGTVHLFISLLVAIFAALVVLLIWYPYPYSEISGGRELFMLMVAVDVVIGPLITLVIFNRSKPRCEFLLDFTLIGLLQLVALSYGLWTVYVARPVYLVFEYHRMAVVHAADVDSKMLKQALPNLQILPIAGPALLSLRPFKDSREQIESTVMALNGLPQAAQPALWQTWSAARADILKESHPIAQLNERFGTQVELINSAIATTGRPVELLRYLPLVGRKQGWTVLIDGESAEPVGFLPLDSF